MTTKGIIVSELGESAVLLPNLIADALMANDRAKLRMSLLQSAISHAERPNAAVADFSCERAASDLADSSFDGLVGSCRIIAPGLYQAPGASALIAGLFGDLAHMLTPFDSVDTERAQRHHARLRALAARNWCTDDTISKEDVAALTSAQRGRGDTPHLLVMDVHKELNQLAAETASEVIDGARVHRLAPEDRPRVAAFMRGLSRTAPLVFGHPGLGTTATRAGERLVIQNDIGTTDAHVLVLHVQERTATLTYTDIHRVRAVFFREQFASFVVEWSSLTEAQADRLSEGSAFFLITGRFAAKDAEELDAFLAFLASRIVFLIDRNKARKALRLFVDKKNAVDVLAFAARRDIGHRAFLELGGPELIYDAVRRVAGLRVPYGARLDAVLGPAATVDFLRRVLAIATEGLMAHRSERLIRDEIQADLALRFERAESALLGTLIRHVGLSRMMASSLAEVFVGGFAPSPIRERLAVRAKQLEKKADRITIELRALSKATGMAEARLRDLIDAVEDAADSLEEATFLTSLLPNANAEASGADSLAGIAELAVDSATNFIKALSAGASTSSRADAEDALQAIDAVFAGERRTDTAARSAIATLVAETTDPKRLVVCLEIADAVEQSTDHFARAAHKLRDRLLTGLSQ